ncbi:MAG: 6-phosphofructokinase [Planctomycetes bacterium]|nr:6-phosphofructokinase [Planctomycetota bacterium]
MAEPDKHAPRLINKGAAGRLARPPAGNVLIGQSGGPTVVINQSLVGIVQEVRRHPEVFGRIWGARHGVAGILKDDLLDLDRETDANLERVALTPAAALGSVRKKPSREECLALFENLRKRDVRYLFYIGGNDSAETANIVLECARNENYPIRVIHVPKTIDNDLRVTDHCPGYGSAAKFVAQAFIGDNLDNRSLPGVKINVIMGRHAGFLTAASVLGRQFKDDGPHLVYVPEVAFDEHRFVQDVLAVHEKLGRCLVAVSEGVHDAAGVTVAERLAARAERDAHGNVQLSGSGALGDHLAGLVKAALPRARVRADTFGYLQRSFAGVFSETDAAEARLVGVDAVTHALKATSGTVVLKRVPGPRYKCVTALAPLEDVAKVTRSLERRYINKAGNNITPAFLEYAGPLAGTLHPVGRLKGM